MLVIRRQQGTWSPRPGRGRVLAAACRLNRFNMTT